MHRKGVEAEHYVKDAKERSQKSESQCERNHFLRLGGTESDNLALIGVARANKRRGNHLITSSIEHPAILNTMRHLEEEEGFRVTYLPVDAAGRIRLDALKEALCEDTILVSVMYVNNEVGTVQPIEEAVQMVKAYDPQIIFHSDAVQGYGKYRIYPKRMGIDLLPPAGIRSTDRKGSVFSISEKKVKITPIVYGGEQQEKISAPEQKMSRESRDWDWRRR